MKVYEGKLVSEKIRVGIIAARFNEFITSKLLSGALDTLKRHNVEEEDIHVAWVPGAFEIAQVSLSTGIPVMFGVVTTENIEQAIERAGTKAGNKGSDCAESAIEMVNLIREMA